MNVSPMTVHAPPAHAPRPSSGSRLKESARDLSSELDGPSRASVAPSVVDGRADSAAQLRSNTVRQKVSIARQLALLVGTATGLGSLFLPEQQPKEGNMEKWVSEPDGSSDRQRVAVARLEIGLCIKSNR